MGNKSAVGISTDIKMIDTFWFFLNVHCFWCNKHIDIVQ